MSKSDKFINILEFSNKYEGVWENDLGSHKVVALYHTIENKLEKMQSVVGGLIDRISLHCFVKNGVNYSIDLVINDEGKLDDLPISCFICYNDEYSDLVFGSCFIALANEDTGEYISLKKEYFDKLKQVVFEIPYTYNDKYYVLPLLDLREFSKIVF